MRRFAKNNKTMTDPIADFLTRIRNAYRAGNRIVEIPSSKMKVAITKILCEKGYILSYKIVEGRMSSSVSPFASRSLNAGVLACSSASDSALYSSASASI